MISVSSTFTDGERVSVEARRTLTLVTARHVLADCVEPAGGSLVGCTALVSVLTLASGRITCVPGRADAHMRARVLVLDTHFTTWARQLRPTRLWYLRIVKYTKFQLSEPPTQMNIKSQTFLEVFNIAHPNFLTYTAQKSPS